MTTIEEIIERRRNAAKNGEKINFYNEEDVRIYVTIDDEEEIFNSYSVGGYVLLSEEMGDFIEIQAKASSPAKVVALDVYSDDISDETKPEFVKALKNSQIGRRINVERKLRRNLRTILFWGLLGAVLIVSSVAAYTAGALPEAICEVVDIVAWVCLWTCAEAFIFERNELLEERTLLDRTMDMEVEFHPARK